MVYYFPRSADPYINRFIQPDSIVPNPANPQSWNRYSYTINNPLKYTDPSGHAFEYDDNSTCVGDDCASAGKINYLFNHPDKPNRHGGHQEGPGEVLDDNTEGIEPTIPTNIPTPSPPDTMTTVEKYGMGITVAITVLFVVVPIEAALVVLTFGAAGACASGAVLGCLADIPLVAADIAVADFGVSLTVHAAESISSGHKSEFEWIIIPHLIDVFSRKKE